MNKLGYKEGTFRKIAFDKDKHFLCAVCGNASKSLWHSSKYKADVCSKCKLKRETEKDHNNILNIWHGGCYIKSNIVINPFIQIGATIGQYNNDGSYSISAELEIRNAYAEGSMYYSKNIEHGSSKIMCDPG